MLKGKLKYDCSKEQMCVEFSVVGRECLVGLPCGARIDVCIDGHMLPTRIERNANTNNFYLEGLSEEINLSGLPVRL
jgi:hypothetical protein